MEDFSKYNGDGTTLRRAQLRMLDMMVEVDKICRKHDIPYSLDGGTLLGAVRHKGFIPWDDDLDIHMLKKDYKRLRKALVAELPKQYFFSDWTMDKYHFDNYARIKDRNSVFSYPPFAKQSVQGVFIDVFTFSKIPSIRTRKFVNFFYRRVFREIHHFGDTTYQSNRRRVVVKLIAYLMSPIVYAASFMCRGIATLSRSKLMAMDYIKNTITIYDDEFLPLQEIEFEGKMFKCIANPDEYLRRIYGDYMQLPPEEKRLPHVSHITIYE